MHREPNIFTCGDNPIRHDAALHAAHPVGQHDLGHPAQLGEALAQHRQRRGRLLIGGEPHEPPPRPRQHRTEDMDSALGAPVNDQMLTRGPDRRAAATVVLDPPVPLRLGDQPAEVSSRPLIPGHARGGQQPLRRDQTGRLLHPRRDQVGDDLIVTDPALGRRAHTPGRSAFDHPLDGLGRRPADRGGATVRTSVLIGGNDGHSVPRRLQWSSLGGVVTG